MLFLFQTFGLCRILYFECYRCWAFRPFGNVLTFILWYEDYYYLSCIIISAFINLLYFKSGGCHTVVFRWITFKIFKGDQIVHGVMHKPGVFLTCGPCVNVYMSNLKMPGCKYGYRITQCSWIRTCPVHSSSAIATDIEWKRQRKSVLLWPALKETILASSKKMLA